MPAQLICWSVAAHESHNKQNAVDIALSHDCCSECCDWPLNQSGNCQLGERQNEGFLAVAKDSRTNMFGASAFWIHICQKTLNIRLHSRSHFELTQIDLLVPSCYRSWRPAHLAKTWCQLVSRVPQSKLKQFTLGGSMAYLRGNLQYLNKTVAHLIRENFRRLASREALCLHGPSLASSSRTGPLNTLPLQPRAL